MYSNLKAEIARHGKKKSELAAKLGITENTLINKIKGKSEFTLTEIQELLKEFPNSPLLDDAQIDVLAYAFGGLIEEFYENPINQTKFEEWKKNQKKEGNASENEGNTQGKGHKSQSSCGKSRNRRANDK